MRYRQWLLLILLVVPGVAGFIFCMYYAFIDWALLQKTFTNFTHLASGPADMKTIFVAEAQQNIHRINVFADVVWALLSAIIAAIGIHGLCANQR